MNRIEVVKVEHLDNLVLRVWFNDSTSKDIDFEVFLDKHPHPQYDKYRQPKWFGAYTIRNGNLVWGRHADLSFPVEALHAGDLEITV